MPGPQPLFTAILTLHALGAPTASPQDPAARPPLAVAVVGAVDAPRTRQLVEILRRAGHRPRSFDRATPLAALHAFHVVVVDWTGTPDQAGPLPLSPLERWDRPMVLVGDTGTMLAVRYGLPTPAVMAALAAAERGPEMERCMPPEGVTADVWRQGQLFHFPLATSPGEWPAAEQQWFTATVAAAAHFVTDRALVRTAPPPGTPAATADLERRERIAAAAQRLGVDPSRREDLLALPSGNGATAEAELALLRDLIDGGPADPTRPNNWRSWLTVHGAALCRDPLSACWRLDPVAFGRGVPSAGLRGAARADGLGRDPAVEALASRIANFYGARGLADLRTFTTWWGNTFVAWDRAQGVFRIENHAELAPGALATPWQVAVLDVAADADLVVGGGPPPRPRVSARSAYRELVAALFVPLLLQEPGTAVEPDPEVAGSGRQRLRVRLAGRGIDPTTEYVLSADERTGEVASIETWVRGKLQSTRTGLLVEACGPLRFPAGGEFVRGRMRRAEVFRDLRWNPELPVNFAAATERLATPPGK